MTVEAGCSYAPAARQALAAFGVEPAELHFVHLSENVTFRATDARDGASLVRGCTVPGTTISPSCDRSICGPALWSRLALPRLSRC